MTLYGIGTVSTLGTPAGWQNDSGSFLPSSARLRLYVSAPAAVNGTSSSLTPNVTLMKYFGSGSPFVPLTPGVLSGSQVPDRSGLPSFVFGAGAVRIGLPSFVRGTFFAG